MLLVTVGLAGMYTVGGFLRLSAIDQASALVFDERLARRHRPPKRTQGTRSMDRMRPSVAVSKLAARGELLM